MNLLINETSPYLLQHATNPVHWMPWCEAAFEKAREQNKPVLVSIGYSSCHWCHVMEQESFQDEAVAGLMNQFFISIKVDREEYPDIDHLYMDAVQALTGSGGWPLHVFLTPDKKPFYGGTYFPPKRVQGRASWTEVLTNVAKYYNEHRSDVDQQGEKLIQHLRQLSVLNNLQELDTDLSESRTEIFSKITDQLLEHADKEYGGFGNAPKFPSCFLIQYLLDHAVITDRQDAKDHALHTLNQMMRGGIYDHLAGGFSRYSTDKYWIAPHFEKMLYDNALLIETYAIAFQITGKQQYRSVINQTFEWLIREMKSPEGGFYAAQDSDTEHEEGLYYTWSQQELIDLLGEDADWVMDYFSVSTKLDLHEKQILHLHITQPFALTDDQRLKLPLIREQMRLHRSKRIRPMTDIKILLGWNALMCRSLYAASVHLDDQRFSDCALSLLDYLLETFRSEEPGYFHVSVQGKASITAYADDLVYLADACLYIGKLSGRVNYLFKAREITDYLQANYIEEGQVFCNFTHLKQTKVAVNKQDIYDNATPSVNAVYCRVLYQLSLLFLNDGYGKISNELLQRLSSLILKYPTSFGLWSVLWQQCSVPFREMVIAGDKAVDYFKILHNKEYKPGVIWLVAREEDGLPALQGKFRENETLIYLCNESTCRAPFRDVNKAFTEI